MAQRKSTPGRRSSAGNGGSARSTTQRAGSSATRPGSSSRSAASSRTGSSTARSSTARSSTATKASARPVAPANKRPGKSIVNQRQTPWALIATATAVVLFAAAIIAVVVVTGNHKSASQAAGVDPSDPYRQPQLAATKSIPGLTYKVEPDHTHTQGHITYDSSPPVGGNHSQYWADCSGTVYPQPIANENAVHMLEHGAIWITYNAKTLPAAQLATLTSYVKGVDRMALSPYPNLKTPISLQAWGYQLFVRNANDPRIQEFISELKYNKATTPEYGATCSQPTFVTHPSTFGHPLWVPASGSSGNTGGA